VEGVTGGVDKVPNFRHSGRLEADPEPIPVAVVMTMLERFGRANNLRRFW
jgi:hypothetical protein